LEPHSESKYTPWKGEKEEDTFSLKSKGDFLHSNFQNFSLLHPNLSLTMVSRFREGDEGIEGERDTIDMK
jgi:hypothetical protein